MPAFAVRLPSGQRYWTVLDEDLRVVGVADEFLRYQRFGRDGAESTTKAYAHAIALFLRWCARTGRDWQVGVEWFGLFMTWLAHAGPNASSAGVIGGGAVVLAGPGVAPARSPSRINGVLSAVRGMVVHAVAAGAAPAGLVSLLYEVADDRDLPEAGHRQLGRAMRCLEGSTGCSGWGRAGLVEAVAPSYKGFRFPVEIISHCVWLYHRFPLSFREVGP